MIAIIAMASVEITQSAIHCVACVQENKPVPEHETAASVQCKRTLPSMLGITTHESFQIRKYDATKQGMASDAGLLCELRDCMRFDGSYQYMIHFDDKKHA